MTRPLGKKNNKQVKKLTILAQNVCLAFSPSTSGWQHLPEHSQQWIPDWVSIIDVDVIPAALCGKVVEAEANGRVGFSLDQPGALGVNGVVAIAVCDDAWAGWHAARAGKMSFTYGIMNKTREILDLHFFFSKNMKIPAKKTPNPSKTVGLQHNSTREDDYLGYS